jgi:hypothetical protein
MEIPYPISLKFYLIDSIPEGHNKSISTIIDQLFIE